MTDSGPPGGLVPRDKQWLERLFRDHHGQVLAYARRRVGTEADDIVSDVFATAWQRREAVPDDALPWLYRTAGNHILHAHRASARRARTVSAAPLEHGGSDFAAGADEKDLIMRVLRDLSERDQEILRLWAWEHLELTQISDVLGCSSVAARVRLHRATRRLQTRLSAADPDSAPARPRLPSTPLMIKD